MMICLRGTVFLWCFVGLTGVGFWSYGQAVGRKTLPHKVNLFGRNNRYPIVTADGRYLLYVSDYSKDKKLALRYAEKKGGVWQKAQTVPEVNRLGKLDYTYGYGISPDGRDIYYSSKRGKGIGGYDIFWTKKTGSRYAAGLNLGKPVNSPTHDASPSFTPDYQTMYFMRCGKMSRYEASDCQIYMSKKRGRTWGKPERLPDVINQGHVLHPQVTPDGLGLLFVSDKAGQRDVYFSRKKGKSWTDPVPMSFVNTDKDDFGATMAADRNEIYFSMFYKGYDQLIVSQIPQPFKPIPVVNWVGEVTDQNGQQLKGFGQVYDATTHEKVSSFLSDDQGHFSLIFPVETWLDVSVSCLEKQYGFVSQYYIADSVSKSMKREDTVVLPNVLDGWKYATPVFFEPKKAAISPQSTLELQRLLRVLKNNPQLDVNIHVYQSKVQTDSVASPRCPLQTVDSVLVKIPVKTVVETVVPDTADQQTNAEDSTESPEDKEDDGFAFVEISGDQTVKQDTLAHKTAKTDTVAPVPTIKMDTVVTYKNVYQKRVVYHNDFTESRAQVLAKWLISKGYPRKKISVEGHSSRFGTDDRPESIELLPTDTWAVFDMTAYTKR